MVNYNLFYLSIDPIKQYDILSIIVIFTHPVKVGKCKQSS